MAHCERGARARSRRAVRAVRGRRRLNGFALPSCDSLVTEVASAHKTERNFGFLYSDVSTALFVTLVLLGVLIDYTAASFPVVDIGGFCARAVIVARTIGSGVARDR